MKHAVAMAEQGYSFVDDVLEADGEELAQLTKDVQMKTSEARRFLKAVAARKSAALDTGGGGRDGDGGPSCPIQASSSLVAALCHGCWSAATAGPRRAEDAWLPEVSARS